jgi:nucleotide-binding universal stress UspA family protein
LAEREGADLIVLGVAGRSSVDMAFFGSTTNHVVRAASCPVMSVRARISE